MAEVRGQGQSAPPAVETVADLLRLHREGSFEVLRGQQVVTLKTMPEYLGWDRLSARCLALLGSDDEAGLRRAVAAVALHSGKTQNDAMRLPLPAFLELLEDASQSDRERATDGPWSPPDSPGRWAKLFKVNPRTFKRHVAAGKIRGKRLSDRLYQVHVGDLPAKHQPSK